MTQVQIFDENTSSGDVNITCIDDEGQKVTKAHTYYSLPSTMFMIPLSYQGLTSDDGKIKALGVKVGNMISIQCTKKFYIPLVGYVNIPYFKNYTITSISGTEKDAQDSPLEEEEIVVLNKVKGDYRFVSSWSFDKQGILTYNLFSKSSLTDQPVVVIPDEKSDYKIANTRYDDKTISYSAKLSDITKNDGVLQLSLKDESNNPFFIPVHYLISERQEKMSAPLGSAEITIDPKNSEFRTVAFLVSDFLPITEGLVREPEHVGYVVSITSFPQDFLQGSKNILMMRYSRSDLILKNELTLQIHRWDENSRKWVLIPSTVDTTEQLVTAIISQNGTYALFTTDLSTGYDEMNDNNYFGLKVLPNPVSNEAEVQFALINPDLVSLTILDSFGREISEVFSEYRSAGIHKVKVNTSSLSSGVYFFTLKSGMSSSRVKAVIIK